MASGGGGIRLRPMGVGDILDETFRVYRRHFLSFVVATAVVAVPTTVLDTALTSVVDGGDVTLGGTVARGFFGAVYLITSVMPEYLLSGPAAVLLASDAIFGRSLSVGAAYRSIPARALSLLIVAIRAGLTTGLVALTVIGLPFAVYLGTGWAVASSAVMIEGAEGRAALRRSSALVHGHRWRVFGTFLSMWILALVLIAVPIGIVEAIMSSASALYDEDSFGLRILLEVVRTFTGAVGQSLFGSLPWITATIVYYELRVRKEALDLEQLAAQAEDPPPPPAFAG